MRYQASEPKEVVHVVSPGTGRFWPPSLLQALRLGAHPEQWQHGGYLVTHVPLNKQTPYEIEINCVVPLKCFALEWMCKYKDRWCM